MLNTKLSIAEAKPIVSRCFPNYRGRRFFLETRDSVTLSNTYWDGGSRSYYVAFNLLTREVGHLKLNTAPREFGGKAEGVTVPLTPETVVVEHHFSGNYQYIIIWAHPSTVLTRMEDRVNAKLEETAKALLAMRKQQS
jgi:hypothetical protein